MGNKLASVPTSVGRLKVLQRLDLSNNVLQHLPDEIGSLEQLVELELSRNKLKRLPESMGKEVRVNDGLRDTDHLRNKQLAGS